MRGVTVFPPSLHQRCREGGGGGKNKQGGLSVCHQDSSVSFTVRGALFVLVGPACVVLLHFLGWENTSMRMIKTGARQLPNVLPALHTGLFIIYKKIQ